MFDQLRYVLTSLGRRLNFGISGRCSAAGARHQEGVTIHIGRDNGESLVEILQQPCENFRRNIEARGLKAVEPFRRECRGRTDVDQGAMAARDKSGNLDALRGHRRFVDQCVAAGSPWSDHGIVDGSPPPRSNWRSDLNAARISVLNSSGCSHGAK
jgi:hypothetical protein